MVWLEEDAPKSMFCGTTTTIIASFLLLRLVLFLDRILPDGNPERSGVFSIVLPNSVKGFVSRRPCIVLRH